MKNLVRGGVVLLAIGMFVVLIYAQTKTEPALNIANDSQSKINKETEVTQAVPQDNNKAIAQDNNQDKNQDKKLVKKTVSESAVASAAGISKGTFTATAYCLRGRTALGHGVRRGIIAADPRLIRLGSRVSLNAGSYSGQYLVSDTGGSVRGRKIDIWVPSCAEARRFGRRKVTVSLLPR